MRRKLLAATLQACELRWGIRAHAVQRLFSIYAIDRIDAHSLVSVDIRDLDYFLACCEAGSFTAAARNAHIVQSAMSSAIARLERDLGVQLFDRSSTPIILTEHGMALQGATYRILDAVQAARDEVAAVSGHVHGTVTLGCTLNTGPLDLAKVLSRVRDRHPDVIIKLRQHSTGSAGNLQGLRDGSVDIALYAVPGNAPADEPPRGIALYQLVSEAIVFVCRPDHPLAGQDRVAVADLRHERLLRFPLAGESGPSSTTLSAPPSQRWRLWTTG